MTKANDDTRPEWFPMRVTYCRELKMKESLDTLGIESFIPMHYTLTGDNDERRMKREPAIHNLIFVHTEQDKLTELKTTRSELEPLRYMMRPIEGGSGKEIIRVPDRQMEHFMRVSAAEDDRVMYLDYGDYFEKVGRHVKVTQGFFAGVEGVIKRIKNNRRVVVQIDGVAAVAITHVPVDYLLYTDNTH